MKYLIRLLQWIFVAFVLVLIVEFPHGVVQPQMADIVQPIHAFSWAEYFHNLGNLGHGILTLSLGKTLDNGYSIAPIVVQTSWKSIELIAIALIFVIFGGVAKGIYDGLHGHSGRKGAVASSLLQWFAESVPDFFVIVTLETIYFAIEIHYQIQFSFIGSGMFVPGTLIPAMTLALVPTMYMARAVRTNVEDQYGQMYLVTAQAKGLRFWQVLMRHLIPNCLPAVRMAVLPVLAMIFSGLIMVEYLYYQHGLLFGLFSAMGNTGEMPQYSQPFFHNGVISAQFNTYDANLVLGYLVASFVVFMAYYLLIYFILRVFGYKRVHNPYASTLRDDSVGSRVASLWVGGGMLAVLLLSAAFRNHLPIPSPNAMDSLHISQGGDVMSAPAFPPSFRHLLGTDEFGRDMLSRALSDTLPTFLYVGGLTVAVLAVSTGLAVLSSVAKWRFVRAFINGWNACFSLIPGVVGALLILEIPSVYWLGVHMEPDGGSYWSYARMLVVLFVVGLIECGKVAYTIQYVLDDAQEKSYIEAAVISGNTGWTQFLLHLWRPLIESVSEQFFVEFNRIIILIAVIGYFQITLRPAWIPVQGGFSLINLSNDWGGLFSETARQYFSSPWVLMAPALLVAWTVFSMNLILQAVRLRLRSVPNRRRKDVSSLAFRWLARPRRNIMAPSVPGSRGHRH